MTSSDKAKLTGGEARGEVMTSQVGLAVTSHLFQETRRGNGKLPVTPCTWNAFKVSGRWRYGRAKVPERCVMA